MTTLPLTQDMVELRLPIREFVADGAPRTAVATRIGPNGIEIECPEAPPGRYAWVGVLLPDGSPIKALVEVMGVLGGGTGLRILARFKHLFPADRRALDRALAARIAA
ncbi:hypothetical protein KBD49_02720 [Myxococcota bacterium]|nr:hypothetical protein [Myxococcota bacterium]